MLLLPLKSHNPNNYFDMDAQKVDSFIMANSKFFHDYQLVTLRETLLSVDDDRWPQVSTLQFHDPLISLIVSLVGGYLGIDRFIIGDVALGLLKLITCGGMGVWTVIDWFLIMGATRDKNMKKLHMVI